MTTPHQLRDYQETAKARVHHEWDTGVTRTAIILPTGTGKTDVIAELCLDEIAAGGKVLALAHRAELIDQLIERMSCYSSKCTVGRIQAGINDINHPMIAASVQTLRRPARMAALDTADWQPSLVVIDEVQHGLAHSYLQIVRWAGCFDDNRRTKLLGVTATLIRGDRQAFDGLFQSVADVMSLGEAFDKKLLAAPVIKRVRLDRFWDRFKFRRLSERQLMDQDSRRIVEAWRRKAKDRITIAYCTNCKEAQSLVDAFTSAEIPVALIIGSTPYEERKLIYKKLAAGDIRVMVNVYVATEGFNCPQVSCIIIDRFTQSPGLLVQIIGRGLRRYTDPVTGKEKTDCLVLDTTGVTEHYDMSTLIDIDPHRVRGYQAPGKFRQLIDRAITALRSE
jgi:superfamily II DNA or RNA helicase